jgi:hypothetical protein
MCRWLATVGWQPRVRECARGVPWSGPKKLSCGLVQHGGRCPIMSCLDFGGRWLTGFRLEQKTYETN